MCVRVPPSELSGYCLRQAVTARICLVTGRDVAVNSCQLENQRPAVVCSEELRDRARTMRSHSQTYLTLRPHLNGRPVGRSPKALETQCAIANRCQIPHSRGPEKRL